MKADVIVVDDPLVGVPVRPPMLEPRPGWGEPPMLLPRAKVERVPTVEERRAKRAQRKAERQRRQAGRAGR